MARTVWGFPYVYLPIQYDTCPTVMVGIILTWGPCEKCVFPFWEQCRALGKLPDLKGVDHIRNSGSVHILYYTAAATWSL